MKWNLNIDNWKKIGKGALIAGAGAALTYLAQNLTGLDFGQHTPLVVAVLSVVVNYVRKALTESTEPNSN